MRSSLGDIECQSCHSVYVCILQLSLNESLGTFSYTIGYLFHMYCGIKSGYMEYMQITYNCICLPLLEQLSGCHQSVLWARIIPFLQIIWTNVYAPCSWRVLLDSTCVINHWRGDSSLVKHSQNVWPFFFQVDSVPRFIHWAFFTYMWVW